MLPIADRYENKAEKRIKKTLTLIDFLFVATFVIKIQKNYKSQTNNSNWSH